MVKMNKRGQIPIIMLFVVALTLVIVTLMSFASFNRAFDDQSLKNSRLVISVNLGEGYIIETAKYAAKATAGSAKPGENIRTAFSNFALSKNIGLEEAQNFFDKIGRNEFNFDKLADGSYSFKMTQIVADAKGTESNILRQFDLCMEFSSAGEFTKNCQIKAGLP